MSRSHQSSRCSRNRDVSTYPNTDTESEKICRTCGLSSRDHPIHCIIMASPAPPSYQSIASSPILNAGTPRRWPRLQSPCPALRFDVQSDAQGRPRMRSRQSTFSPLSPVATINETDFGQKSYTSGSSTPNTPVDDIESIKRRKLGLRIPKALFNSDSSPTRSPGGEKLAKAEKGESVRKEKSHSLAQSASSNMVNHWVFELASWMLSALCMCTITIALFFLQDKPMPKHWPMSITLNAYIAVLSRITSAALLLPVSEALGQLKWSWFQTRAKKMQDFELFDNASRGPWGSFMLLVRTRGTTLAALGAAITVFAMVMDPFFQQVVHYPQRTVLQLQNSSIPKVTRYQTHLDLRREFGGEMADTDEDMSAAVEKFFFDFGVPQVQVGNTIRPEIPLFCPTSNCSWESYETLGVCSECVDVVEMLDFGCFPAKLDWVQNATSYVPYDNGTMCGWFFNATSEDRMLMLGYQVDSSTNSPSGEVLTTRALPLITNINRRPLFGGSINFKHVRNPINNFVVVSTTDGPDQTSILRSVLQHQKPRALECVLSWCVKTIESSYQDATYTEIVKDRFINTTAGPYPWTFIPPDNPGLDPKMAKKVQYVQNVTVDPHAFDSHGNVPSYEVSNYTACDVIMVLDDYLPSFATLAKNASKMHLKYTTWEEHPYIREYPTNPWAAPNNVTHHMERLATVMTNMMRQSSKDAALGKSFNEETYIEVRWVWLSLPVGLLVSTLVFLLGTMRRTSMENERVGIWKNSAIAMLLYKLPDETQRMITTSRG